MLVPDLLRAQALRTPDKAALIVDGIAELRYEQWEAASNRLARALVARGLEPGDRVGLLYSNADAHRFSIAYMAVHKAGGVNVPLNTRLAPPELRYIVDHCGAAALLHGHGLDAACAAAAPVAAPRFVLGPDDQDAHDLSGDLFQISRTDDDLADILYTSGTTGAPKGVACEHGNITFESAAGHERAVPRRDVPPRRAGVHVRRRARDDADPAARRDDDRRAAAVRRGPVPRARRATPGGDGVRGAEHGAVDARAW